jgi:hypothetical protein
LWEVPGEVLKQPGLEGLLPLLPLTKNGARREVVEEMITALQAANKEDLLPIAYAVAALVLTRSEDKKWLKWRFDTLEDIIEESWAYQAMVDKRLRMTLQKLISRRFPPLLNKMQQDLEEIQDPEVLQHLIIEIAIAQTAEEAWHLFSEVVNNQK